jgi:hypothetical protein
MQPQVPEVEGASIANENVYPAGAGVELGPDPLPDAEPSSELADAVGLGEVTTGDGAAVGEGAT